MQVVLRKQRIGRFVCHEVIMVPESALVMLKKENQRSMRAGFTPFDWHSPIDLDALIEAHPRHLSTKGMFLSGFLEEAGRRGRPLAWRSYIGFKDYPSTEVLRLFRDLAIHLYPDVPIHEVLRQLGRVVYPTLSRSLIGRALFAALGKNPNHVLKLVPRGYAVSSQDFVATLLENNPTSALFLIKGYPNFPISLNIGIIEGAVLACDKECEATVRILSPTEAEIAIEWK
jgi:uncharacterized protein (TIGR02265 family)